MVLVAKSNLVWRETTSMLDSKSVFLTLQAIICTDRRVAKDCLFVAELHRLAHDWLGNCHSQLVVPRTICEKPVPVAFATWGQGIMVMSCLMFVVLIHVRKTFAMRLWTFAYAFRHDMCAECQCDYCGMRHLILPQAFEGMITCELSLAVQRHDLDLLLPSQAGETMQAAWCAICHWCHDASSGMPSCTWIAIGRLQINTRWKCMKVCYSPVSSSMFANLQSFCNRYFQ